MDIYGCKFEYAGVSSETYGLIFANAETARNTQIAGAGEVVVVHNKHGWRNYLADVSFENGAMQFDAEVISEEVLSGETQRAVEKWLFYRKGYKRFFPDVEPEIINGEVRRVYLNCIFTNPSKLEYHGGVVGYRFTVVCDAPMAWQEPTTKEFEFAADDGCVYDRTVSGSTVSFENDGNMKILSLTAEIKAKQNLNGYDNPWPGGGGKNRYDMSGNAIEQGNISSDSGNNSTANRAYRVRCSEYTEVGSEIEYTISSNVEYSFLYFYDSEKTYLSFAGWQRVDTGYTFTTPQNTAYMRFVLAHTTASSTGSNIEIAPADVEYVQIERGSQKSDWEPYSNVCPITGFTGLTVTRAGKNLLPNLMADRTTTAGVTVQKNNDGSLTLNGTSTAAASPTVCESTYHLEQKLKPGRYILRGCPAGGSSSTYRLVCSINNGALYAVDTGAGAALTVDASVTYLSIYIRYSADITFDGLTFYPMLIHADEPEAAYEPYRGEEYTVTWQTEAGDVSGEVYGGTLDVTTGELIRTVRMYAMTGNEGSLTKSQSGESFRVSISTNRALPGTSNIVAFSHGIIAAGVSAVSIVGSTDGYSMYFRNFPYSTVEEFREYLREQVAAGTPVQFAYNLAAPVTYQLTPTEVSTLLGENNLWADVDDISIDLYNTDSVVEVDTDIQDYTYPAVEIQLGTNGGDCGVCNHTDNSTRLTSFVDVPAGTTIHMDGESNYVTPGMYEKFSNRNFLRLLPGENKIRVTGNVSKLKLTWQNMRYL